MKVMVWKYMQILLCQSRIPLLLLFRMAALLLLKTWKQFKRPWLVRMWQMRMGLPLPGSVTNAFSMKILYWNIRGCGSYIHMEKYQNCLVEDGIVKDMDMVFNEVIDDVVNIINMAAICFNAALNSPTETVNKSLIIT